MLNKIILTILFFASFVNSSFAETKMLAMEQVKFISGSVVIREPFTSLATAKIVLKNNTNNDLKIEKITSPQVRHVGLYTEYKNDFGAPQVKRIKDVFIKANSETILDNSGIFVMLTGLTRKYNVDDDIELNFEFSGGIKLSTYVKVFANYE